MNSLEVLHRDHDWIAVSKPSGVPTTAPPTAGVRSLVDMVTALVPDRAMVHPLSRLDVEVTGVVLFALTRAAGERARAAKEGGTYRRRYVALTHGVPHPTEGCWTGSIDVDPRDRRLRRVAEGPNARSAETKYTVLAVASKAPVAWLAFDLATGRTHQIRVHAAHAGTPVLGDRSYGAPRHVTLDDGTVLSARRVMLHAARVVVPGTKHAIECAPPADFAALWHALGGESVAHGG